ncbi:MAG TPA: two-component regulator propeller domain-containing protein [Verrucomicrobiae bacterium]|nr:two-component regulator propeller domain-containing protein [Verrucomicrobiae bacterium]
MRNPHNCHCGRDQFFDDRKPAASRRSGSQTRLEFGFTAYRFFLTIGRMPLRRSLVVIWMLLAILFSGRTPAAVTTVLPGSPFVVDAWGIGDGLPQSSVFAVTVTHDGYLWLGTLGLVRFDGLKFTLFDESNTPGLNNSRVLNVFEDTRRRLWAVMENGSVAVIETNGAVQNFSLGQESGGQCRIVEDSKGVVWILTAQLLVRHENGGLNGFFGSWKSIVAEASGDIWLGTDAKLVRLQDEREIPLSGRLDLLLASRKGGYWRLADGRIQKWNGDQRERDFGRYPWGDTPVLTACEDADGNLIVGTYGDGVYWLQPSRQFVHIRDELQHASVLSVTIDREGNLWIGTNGGGLHRVKRRTFGILADSEGRVVQSVAEDAAGGIWVGYNGESRVDYFRDGTNRSLRIIQEPRIAQNCDVKSVFVDAGQRLLAGLRYNGDPRELPLRLFERAGEGFIPLGHNELATENVSVLFQDSKGVMWVGLQNGLVRVQESSVRKFTQQDGLAGDEVRAIREDHEGHLWIATRNGLSMFETNRFTTFRKADGLPSDDLSCLYVDSTGELWVGTRGSGVARLHRGKWIYHTIASGLSGNSIGYVIEDAEKNLWIGSNAGLMRVTRESLDAFAEGRAARVLCRTYIEADGLPSRECTQGSQPSAARTADGTLWFPTTRGLVSVQPDRLRQNPFHPPVIIESILVAGIEQITNRLRAIAPKVLVIPPGRESLEFHFTSLNLGAAEQSRFRYRLEGHEDDWIDADTTRSVRYTRLAPREYRFLVTAANEDGVWNPNPAIQLVRVEPPFWRTAWFLALVTVVTLGLIVGTVHYLSTQRLQRELAELKRQEELEKERARIARDLHDQLGANLTQVALLGELAEADKELPEEVEGHARQITDTARETTKALDEIVWAVNPSNDTLDGLVNYLCKYAQEYFELAGLRYRIEVPAELPKLTLEPEVRHNVFLAAKEAVNNVIKHAAASAAWLRLHLEPGRFTLEIEDDGKGPAGMNQKTGRNGLRNMRKRLEDIGGSFSIDPAATKGTRVRLSAPIKKAR